MTHLTPAPFPKLVRRMLREAEAEGKIFDLPSRRFWRGAERIDASVVIHGRRVANPLGPAAGPHGQMAQNILSSWLAGGRFIELKTVQVNDALIIPRPCIDMETVGYNVEWSQELRLAESLREYVAGSMLIDIARAQALLGRPDDPRHDDTVFDLSVGYDLAGVRSSAMRGWIASMMDARVEVEALRAEIPDDLAHLRRLPFKTALSGQVTLSTFHGCPAGEIEAMALFLMEEMGLDVTVKLNPTLLGKDAVDGILHDVLGYGDVVTRAVDFDADLQWGTALEMADRLRERARGMGRGLRLKLSNTLVVRNHRRFFPPGEEAMYLSGPPLHVLTLALVERFRRARPEIPLSFSAGVDSRNFADCVALGLAPVTVCTDLLKPGGYGRLPRYLENLEERMIGMGVATVSDFVLKACGQGEAAIGAVVPPSPLRDALVTSLQGDSADLKSVLAASRRQELYDEIVRKAAVLNTPTVVARALADPRYRAASLRPPRRIGRQLALFDCINCDKCLPACPNDANFVYEALPVATTTKSYRVEQGVVVEGEGRRMEIREAHQIATFQDFCNECGNCDTFCPEDGGPYLEKPRFFGSFSAWQQQNDRDGFFVSREDGHEVMWGRIRGIEYRLEVDRSSDLALFGDAGVKLELRHSTRDLLAASAATGSRDGHALDGSAYVTMAALLDGVLDPRRTNPVNV